MIVDVLTAKTQIWSSRSPHDKPGWGRTSSQQARQDSNHSLGWMSWRRKKNGETKSLSLAKLSWKLRTFSPKAAGAVLVCLGAAVCQGAKVVLSVCLSTPLRADVYGQVENNTMPCALFGPCFFHFQAMQFASSGRSDQTGCYCHHPVRGVSTTKYLGRYWKAGGVYIPTCMHACMSAFWCVPAQGCRSCHMRTNQSICC